MRSPLVLVVLALLARRQDAPAGGRALPRWGLGAVAVRLLAPLLLPVALVGSLVGVLGVVLLLAAGITVATRMTGLG